MSAFKINSSTQNLSDMHSHFLTNSSLCQKSFFNSIKKKVSLPFRNRQKESITKPTRSLRKKSFKILSDTFKELKVRTTTTTTEDHFYQSSHYIPKKFQTGQSKYTVCPKDHPINLLCISNVDKSKLQNLSLSSDEVQSNGQKFSLVESQMKSKRKINSEGSTQDTSTYLELRERSLAMKIRELSMYGWYWGPLSCSEAEEKLSNQPDGAFLIRDSSDVKYLLSLSFRHYGLIFHTRIEHGNGLFSFSPQNENDSYQSIVCLINQCVLDSHKGLLYSRTLSNGSSFPLQLTKPVSRFMQIRSLQHLSRFVIRQCTNIHHIHTLPIPGKIKEYLLESYY